MAVPKEIKILSDGNVLTYTQTLKVKDGVRYEYEYTKSKTKLHDVISFSESELNKLIQVNS